MRSVSGLTLILACMLVAAVGVATGACNAFSASKTDEPPSNSDGGGGGGAEGGDDGAPPACNGGVECAGKACDAPGFACRPAAPPGFSGPFLLFDTTTAAAGGPSLCSGDFSVTKFKLGGDLIPESATCGCTCTSNPAGCTGSAIVKVHEFDSCQGNVCGTASVKSDECVNIATAFTNCVGGSVNVTGNIDGAGSCTPQANVTRPPPHWSRAAVACTGPADLVRGGCASDQQVCGRFSSNGSAVVCVAQSGGGDLACPAPYSTKKQYFSGFDDQRQCPQCACGPYQGLCTNAAGNVWSNATCDAPAGGEATMSVVPAVLECPILNGGGNGNHFAKWTGTSTPMASSCQVVTSGAAPFGEIVPNGPVTVCCLQ